MLETGGDLNFPEESVWSQADREVWVEDLERNRAAVPKILGQVDRGHAASTEFPVESVASGQRGLELFEEFRHETALQFREKGLEAWVLTYGIEIGIMFKPLSVPEPIFDRLVETLNRLIVEVGQ